MTGSSPRMRGALVDGILGVIWIRIIPADAGSTYGLRASKPIEKDHPRGCGEHKNWDGKSAPPDGSSLRMRGAPADYQQRPNCTGIIPADAGSTEYGNSPEAEAEDHPRGCGEHLPMRYYRMLRAGSSPRMRGALTLVYDGSVHGGIIPADAGSTTRAERQMDMLQDHPRGCGEHP